MGRALDSTTEWELDSNSLPPEIDGRVLNFVTLLGLDSVGWGLNSVSFFLTTSVCKVLDCSTGRELCSPAGIALDSTAGSELGSPAGIALDSLAGWELGSSTG